MESTVRFGRFELDTRTRELRKDGIRIRLQGQPFEVLALLLESPGTMLTREELRHQLWPGGTFVDFEHGLNAAVKRLRGALGDNAEQPRFVETLPRLGYRFIGTIEAHGQDAVQGTAAPQKRRIAVLPFAWLSSSGDAGQEHFSEGLREEMITQLGRLCSGRLGVIARTSSTLIQRTATRVRDIGHALRVDYIVEGHVRRDGERVRITVQLIEARGETQLWADSYERRLCDAFDIQSEVAAEIVQALVTELLPSTPSPGTKAPNLEAQRAYLTGRYHWNRSGTDGCVPAITYFERAVALDDQFGCAHSALARARIGAVNYDLLPPRSALGDARREALRALELDPTDSEAHLALAEIGRTLDWDWAGAEKAFRRALACNPSNVAALRLYSLFLAARKKMAEAAAIADRAYELDPLCLVMNTSAALVRYLARDYAPAIERCRHTLDMDERFAPARRLLAAALQQAGRTPEAAAELETLAADRPDPVSLAWLVHGLASLGDRARAGSLLEQLDVAARDQYVPAYHLALAHTAIGDEDGALRLLATAFELREPSVINLAVEPRFDTLLRLPQYQTLVRELALPD